MRTLNAIAQSFALWLIIALALATLAACGGIPVCEWHPVNAEVLAYECHDWDSKLRGCQVERAGRCHLYVLERP